MTHLNMHDLLLLSVSVTAAATWGTDLLIRASVTWFAADAPFCCLKVALVIGF
jgi:hypothetical protein